MGNQSEEICRMDWFGHLPKEFDKNSQLSLQLYKHWPWQLFNINKWLQLVSLSQIVQLSFQNIPIHSQ